MQKKKADKSKSIKIDCRVDENTLLKVVEIASKGEFFIEIGNLEIGDLYVHHIELMKVLDEQKIRYASKCDDGNLLNIIMVVDKSSFSSLAGTINECDAEVVVLYFPSDLTTFDKFLYNQATSFRPQRRNVNKGLCTLACTWITNDFELYIDFDSSKFSSDELIRQMTQ